MNAQELEKQINTSVIVIGTKINALKSVLTDEQIKSYHNEISKQKINVESTLKNLLTNRSSKMFWTLCLNKWLK